MSGSKDKYSFIQNDLNDRRKEHRLRELKNIENIQGTSKVSIEGKELINFCSNDYLGLASHSKVKESAATYAEKYGAGSRASRLVSGSLAIHKDLEDKLAEVFGYESALIFNSGFQANSTLLPTLADRNSLILADKKCHNSLIQGALLSRAVFRRFEHNNSDHLQSLLESANRKTYNRIWVVTETVFSMDGDQNKLDDIIKLCDDFDALLYSDDAHALGVLGKNGLGLNYRKEGIDINLGTFGKSFGSFGAFVGCKKEIKEYLINYCPGFIYTTALPPAVIGAIDAALDLIPAMDAQRNELLKKVNIVKVKLHELGFDTGNSDSQIIPIVIGSDEETLKLSNELEKHGILASAIRPPTVEEGSSRIRLTFTVNHSDEDINQLIKVLEQWARR